MSSGAAAQEQSDSTQTSQPQLRLTPQELDAYEHARTLLDWTPQQFKDVPFLRLLKPAANQDALPAILDRVGKTALQRFQEFPKIACDEKVFSETNSPGVHMAGGPTRSYNTTSHQFRYIIIPKTVGGIQQFDEYRTDAKGKPVSLASLGDLKMLTSRFAGFWLYFTPSGQASSRFRHFGTETIESRLCNVVGFAQKPDARNVSGFTLEDRSVPLPFQGLAWIDAQTYQILKIRTWLLAPLEDIQLEDENTLVEYSPVQLAGLENSLWLPREVRVTIFFRGFVFRNTHRYSKIELFRVESTIKPAE